MENCIRVQGARVNNLKNISVEIPRDKLVVLTGLSGSGKSSLAFDTIFAEGQRRYVESLSSYARMFLGQMDKPDVDSIDGLSPAISIDQKTTSRNPRSTVGTVTEIYDYLRLLWARVGTPHCPKCGKEIRQQTVDQIVDQIWRLPERTKFRSSPRSSAGKRASTRRSLRTRGARLRPRARGRKLYDLSEDIRLDKNKKHHIEIVVDRLVMKPDIARRLTDSVETASNLSGGLVIVNESAAGTGHALLPELRLRGLRHLHRRSCRRACSPSTTPTAPARPVRGLGSQLKADPRSSSRTASKSILDGAISASGWNNVRDDSISRMYFEALAKKYHFSLQDPGRSICPARRWTSSSTARRAKSCSSTMTAQTARARWSRPLRALSTTLDRRFAETQSDAMRKELEECMCERPCPTCDGRRLSRDAWPSRSAGMNIMRFLRMPVTEELTSLTSCS